MTVVPTAEHFQQGLTRPRHLAAEKLHGRRRGLALAATVLVHVLLLAVMAVRGHVVSVAAAPALVAEVDIEKVKPALDLSPPPLEKPAQVTAPPPEVVIQTADNLVRAAAPSPEPVASPAVSAPPQTITGEGRDAFLARLLMVLNRAKRYPPEARRAHIEGIVMVHFVMDASGMLTYSEISKSSGRPVLDREALALMQRAQPLPPLPAGFPSHTLDAVVPIVFSLNG